MSETVSFSLDPRVMLILLVGCEMGIICICFELSLHTCEMATKDSSLMNMELLQRVEGF